MVSYLIPICRWLLNSNIFHKLGIFIVRVFFIYLLMPSVEFLCYWVYRDDELFFYDIEAKEVSKYDTEKNAGLNLHLRN
ncbi:MAG TPA: hypothetical protein PLI27_06575 [Ignavibacteriales bacterium]|nr:hypothetical protein [Ignavibacteriales bacterium]HOL81360.1 hypothetical protein [Ignavibacteriales bacterium]HOM65476.1 hypothetical protein [Ignavibacteriales bacterium]HPD67722.1 hypothetical protein [Ignavibacteriales bacterium]HPP33871.1 hypothetical protein [Ignavibacteriales bacterium]